MHLCGKYEATATSQLASSGKKAHFYTFQYVLNKLEMKYPNQGH